MGVTRQAVLHYFDKCYACAYCVGHDCTYKGVVKDKCIYYRKGKKLDCPKAGISLLKDIKGFDDVGIGVIWLDAGKGTYIRCVDLKGYDLKGIQIYRYSNFFRKMYKSNEILEDSAGSVYCVKREDMENGNG